MQSCFLALGTGRLGWPIGAGVLSHGTGDGKWYLLFPLRYGEDERYPTFPKCGVCIWGGMEK